MWQKITELLGFTGIHDESVWQHILVSSFLIPLVIYFSVKLYRWWNAIKPSRQVFKKYLTEQTSIYIFHSTMSSADDNWNLVSSPKYITRFPQPLPNNHSNVGIQQKWNIDPVTSLADNECVADVFNVLGQVHKTLNIILADLMNNWNITSSPIFTVGFNQKTLNLIESSQPMYFLAKDIIDPNTGTLLDVRISIKDSSIEFDSAYPFDSGVIQKSFDKESGAPVFILAGIGTAGTKAAGYVLKEYYIKFGKLYGSKPFCVFFRTKINEGIDSTSIQKIVPHPTLLRRILYPLLYYKFWKRKYFKLN